MTTAPSLIRDELLHELFEATCDRYPDRTALECGGTRIAYAELDRISNQWARLLKSRGVGAGERVAIFLPRSGEAVVAILAVLKAGAVYVPIDSECPAERLAYILEDCGIRCVVTTAAFAMKMRLARERCVLLDEDAAARAMESGRLAREEVGTSPDDACYIIYTSGSTGKPKGVEVSHRAVCHLVRAEGLIFGVGPEDRVFQGFSIAFDASVEEIWLALFSGATLVVATSELLHSGADLPRHMGELGITVLSCVPTLLAMMPQDVPGIRLLILGGEACPPDLVKRWSRPGRRMVNTYGPTEATVIATFADLSPDRPVTIGRALPNYTIRLLDENLAPVETGQTGELCIGGVGLARGYVNRPELTRERFIEDPLEPGERLYRTGDLARYSEEGELEFLGRNDAQVKLRGFRIELTEIETLLLQRPEVLAAAVAVKERAGAMGVQQLVAYIVLRVGRSIDAAEMRAWLRPRLPAYMIPTAWETLDALPTFPSGKVDRTALPAPRIREIVFEPAAADDSIAGRLVRIWAKLFGVADISRDSDFFTDLGGHSLLAATMVSQLRGEAEFADLSVPDVYSFPTIEKLAAELEARRAWRSSRPVTKTRAAAGVSPTRYLLCGVAQALMLCPLLGLYVVQWLGPFLVYWWLAGGGKGIASMLAAMGFTAILQPAMLIIAIAAKWLLLGRIRAGSYPLWGGFYLRWWAANIVQAMAPVGLLAGTPLMSLYYRLMGARIGRDVVIGADSARAYDLLSLGDGTSIGDEVSLAGYVVSDGMLHIGPIRIGGDCFVGSRAIVAPDTVMEDGSALGEMSLLGENRRIGRGQSWAGSPAKATNANVRGATAGDELPVSTLRRGINVALHAAGVLILPMLYMLAFFPGVLLLHRMSVQLGGIRCLIMAPVAAVAFVLLLCGMIVALKWALLGRLKPGRFSVHSGRYVRKWFVDRLMEMSIDLLGPLYATLYLAPWYRALGVKLGRGAEVSNACAASPDLLQIDEGAFIADAVSLGGHRLDRGMVQISPTRVGKRSFIGNSAFVPAGAQIGESVLVGVLSTTPASDNGIVKPETSWIGSPAIYLPQRQQSTPYSEEQTFKPPRSQVALRLFVELFRMIGPSTGMLVCAIIILEAAFRLRTICSWPVLALVLPAIVLACGILACAAVVGLKWLLMGRYKAGEHPLWSGFVYRTELITALHEYLAVPMLIGFLRGTPFCAMFFRALGAKIGKRTYLETTWFTEYDLVEVGDEAMLADDCTIQTHLFEDRVMKMSHIRIGAGCRVGAGSVVLYDTKMAAGSALGELSLLMKGEELPADTEWEGTPARRSETRVRESVEASPAMAAEQALGVEA